ncbi:MAG: hypothetical protein J6B75_02920 [Ruminococcus sp.]|nr:hypothetical protein [Ruminococcus sp.]
MMKKTTKKNIGIIVISFLLIVILLCVFNKFPIVKIGKEFHTVFATELKLNDTDEEIVYDNNDVSTLNRMGFLEEFEMYNTDITDLSFLKNMPNLKHFYCNCSLENPITDWRYLQECKKMTVFCGEMIYINDLSAFKGLTELEELYLEYMYEMPLMVDNAEVLVSDLSGLETLVNLKKCYINGRGISDISQLKSCQKITHLGLRGVNAETDCSVLLELPELTELNMDIDTLPDEIKEKLIAKGVEVYEYDY